MPLSIDSLLELGARFQGGFVTKVVHQSWQHPFSFLGVGVSPKKEFSIAETSRQVKGSNYQPDRRIPEIEFNFEPQAESYAGKIKKVTFSKEALVQALANPEILENGDKGVFVSNRLLFDSSCESGGLGMVFSLFLGSGYGERTLALIFDKNDKLKNIRIEENFRGRRELFLAKDLIPVKELRQEQRAKQQLEENERDAVAGKRRFAF